MGNELTVTRDDYSAGLERILATTKREAPVVLREQGRGIMRWVQLYTAPGHEGVTGQEAKRHGESCVESDIRKLMYGVKGLQIGVRTDIEAIHKSARMSLRRKGRVSRKGLARPIAVPADALDKYIGSKRQMVGFLASGWNEAAGKVGFKPPQWIWRHKGEGDMREITASDSVKIVATNRVNFASTVMTQLKRVLNFAYKAQQGANDRRWKTFIERQARKALKS